MAKKFEDELLHIMEVGKDTGYLKCINETLKFIDLFSDNHRISSDDLIYFLNNKAKLLTLKNKTNEARQN